MQIKEGKGKEGLVSEMVRQGWDEFTPPSASLHQPIPTVISG